MWVYIWSLAYDFFFVFQEFVTYLIDGKLVSCVCVCVYVNKKKIILRHIFLHSFNSKWREEILTYLIHSLTYFTPCLSIFFSLNRNRCDKKISLAKLNKFLCWPVCVDETWEVWDEINRHCPQNKKIKIQKI